MSEDSEENEPWFESVGESVEINLAFHNRNFSVHMPLISPSDSTLPCLAAVLLQTGKAVDCEDALRKVSYHIPAMNRPDQSYFVFVEKNKLAARQRSGEQVRLEKYNEDYRPKDETKSVLHDLSKLTLKRRRQSKFYPLVS